MIGVDGRWTHPPVLPAEALPRACAFDAGYGKCNIALVLAILAFANTASVSVA